MKFFSGAKDRKTRALSKKNRVSSVSDSCRTEVIPAYLSRQGLSPAQLGGMHSAWNILFNFTLPLLPSWSTQWMVSSGPQLPSALHWCWEAATPASASPLQTRRKYKSIAHTPPPPPPDLLNLKTVCFNVQDTGELFSEPLFPPFGHKQDAVFSNTASCEMPCWVSHIYSSQMCVKADCRRVKAS